MGAPLDAKWMIVYLWCTGGIVELGRPLKISTYTTKGGPMNTKTTVSTALVIRNPIKAAVRLSRRMSAQDIENISSEHESAVGVLNRINQLQSGLLPIERKLIPIITSKKTEVTGRVKQLESFDKLNEYAIFSLEPLKWRNKQGFPRLAVFSLQSPNFELAAIGDYGYDGHHRWSQKVDPKLPQEMRGCYKDVLDKLSALAKQARKTTRLRAQFAMLIPRAVKEEIARVRGEFKEIFVVAEVPSWDFKQTVIPRPNKDPLVVGYDGASYWLIAAFDPTPLEAYIKAEFCVKAK